MDQRHNNGAAGGTNSNLNNNVPGKIKPSVPTKPHFLQGGRTSQAASDGSGGRPTDCITPKGWSRQPKFTFSHPDDKLGAVDGKPRSYSESPFTQQYRKAPKVMTKQSSVKQYTKVERSTEISVTDEKNETKTAKSESAYDFAETGKAEDTDDGCTYTSRPHSKSLLHDNNEQREFGSLKRMWSTKSKSPEGLSQSPRQSPRTPHRSRTSDPKLNNAPGAESCDQENSNDQSLSRSASSSSNGSVRTASFKNQSVTWHFVTSQSPTNDFPANALPSKIELNEPTELESGRSKKFDHKILAPRPFKAVSVDEEHSSAATQAVRAPAKKLTEKTVTSQRSPEGRHRRCSRSSSDEDSGSSFGGAGDSDEAEMKIARKRGALVTRFDSRGNMYKVNPRTGEVTYVEDTRESNRIAEAIYSDASCDGNDTKDSSASQRPNGVSLEGATVTESSTDNFSGNRHSRQRKNKSPVEEAPPPLLPREKMNHRSRGTVVPPTGPKIGSSMTSGSMYATRKPRQSPPRGDVSPDAAVPPPLLPRGQNFDEAAPTQDYTPMSAGSDIPIMDKGSVGSSVSLNSYLDQAAYEPMEPKAEEEEIFTEYSAAVDPPKRRNSIREYHEIDPDPDVPIGPIHPGSVPPPPEHEPPSLPDGVKQSRSNSIPNPPASPPPLPPMNINQKRLNYIDVEIGSGAVGVYGGGIRGKSQKTNYTEVIVGGRASASKDDGDAKKGKSVKGKIMSMIFSKSHDGYSSEGDAIETSKHEDDRTTDFAKERNKLKRLSGRLLRKKKHKSRGDSRDSTEIEPTSHSEGGGDHGNVPAAVYGSATNLSTTSSESTRSLSQVASSNSGSSGDGQARPYHASQGNRPRHASDENRRQSYEPPRTQLPPRVQEKSRSEVLLSSPLSYPKSQHHAQNSPQLGAKSAENVSQGYQAQRSGKDAGGSPVISAARVQSHLHQQSRGPRSRNQPPSPRPVSEPPVMKSDNILAPHSRPNSMSGDVDYARRSSGHSKSHDMVVPLPAIKDSDNENQGDSEPLSPNLPPGAPPPPPPLEQLTRPPPPAESPPDLPPAPMRDLKPDRFKKRVLSGGSDAEYTAAQEIPSVSVEVEDGGDPIYDDVYPEMTVPTRNLPLSSSAKSKLLQSEPLYQVYRSRTLSHASMKVCQNPEQRRRIKSSQPVKRNSDEHWQSDLMTDDAGATTLWKEVKEVAESGVGKGLSNDEMKLQQAQFEVVTSQASYMRSLNILIDHFMRDPAMEDPEILGKQQRKELFSNIVAVREVEQKFLQEIEQHFWDKLYLTDISKITAKYATLDFEVYVRYVQNQVYQDRVLTDLQRNNDRFAGELSRLESSPSCNKLPLLSFLLLPMQRVTRLPLLISAIVNQADSAKDNTAYTSAKSALAIVNKLVKKCNEGARKMQQTEQLAEIAKELVFAPKVKTYALVSQSRSVVKKGEMSAIMMQENRKTKAMKLWFFLFSDVLLLARKKNFLEAGTSAKYEVIDWAKRAMLFVNERAVSENEICLVLLENCNGKRVELTLTPVSQNELSRWTDALNPHRAGESEDSIYESWDCPQYQCIQPYSAEQPDELSLDVGDVMRVLKKTSDGWLEGERLRDNELGWFPADTCEEIEDEHVRARNLKNLYRIIPAGGAMHE